MSRHVVIIGGGIAGLSAANALAPHAATLTLVEKEPFAFSHSSGRNAAMYRPLEESPSVTELALRSAALLRELGEGRPLVDACGMLLTSHDARTLELLRDRASEFGVPHACLDETQIHQARPELIGGRARFGIELSSAGVLDIHEIGERLRRRALAARTKLQFGTTVASIEHDGRRVRSVNLADGSAITATDVVLAAGAWSRQLSETCDCGLPLTPHRRHLMQLNAPESAPPVRAITWDMELGAYLRKEGTGILATPGDHEPHSATDPSVAPAQVEALARVLPKLAPRHRDSEVKQVWACLRTLTPDTDMVLGRSARLDGLFWFSGLAGHGMSAGLAAAEALRDDFLGKDSPLLAALSPQRFDAPAR